MHIPPVQMTASQHAPPPLERSSNRLRAGFTLVEIAIVLVIIGMIIGGILVGADLIKAANIRNAASGLERLSTSVYAFRDKYGCIPGDCPYATNYFPATFMTYPGCNGNGDGNGLIDVWVCESVQAIAGLGAAGLMNYSLGPDSGPSVAQTLYFRGYGYSDGYFYNRNRWVFGAEPKNAIFWATYSSVGSINGTAIQPQDAKAVDEKLDDGFPSSGKFQAFDAATAASGGVAVSGACVTVGANAYLNTANVGCWTMYIIP